MYQMPNPPRVINLPMPMPVLPMQHRSTAKIPKNIEYKRVETKYLSVYLIKKLFNLLSVFDYLNLVKILHYTGHLLFEFSFTTTFDIIENSARYVCKCNVSILCHA